jgi:hypothetical protein
LSAFRGAAEWCKIEHGVQVRTDTNSYIPMTVIGNAKIGFNAFNALLAASMENALKMNA